MSRRPLLCAAVLALLSSPVTLAQEPPRVRSMHSARIQEMEAHLASLKARRSAAEEKDRKALDVQIESMEGALKLLQEAQAFEADYKAHRPKLSEDMKAFFTPAPAAKLPAWLPDTLTLAQVTDEQMRCPAGAKVSRGEGAVECRRPGKLGSIPPRHGLTLWFHKDSGQLKSQRYYEDEKLLWSISYHLSGARDSEGLYDSPKRLEYRQTGLHTRYAPDGTVIHQAEYKSGVLHGWSKVWDDDGHPFGATRYENGKAVEQVGPDGRKEAAGGKP